MGWMMLRRGCEVLSVAEGGVMLIFLLVEGGVKEKLDFA